MSKVIEMNRNNHKGSAAKPLWPAEPVRDVVAPESESALKRAADRIVALNRRSTEHAFDLGGCFADVKSLVPERSFGKWLKEFSDYTVRSAWNYISIHERLQDHRAQLVASVVMPTVMFELAKGEPAQIKAAVARLADGEHLKIKDVKELFGTKPKQKQKDDDLLSLGGLAGLRKAAELKTTQDVAQFHELMSAVLRRVEKAMEPIAKGRAVKKGDLQGAIMYDCRHGHDLFNSIAAPMKAEVVGHLNWRPAHLPQGTTWRKVQAMLHRMGGVDGWPDRTDFVPWLQTEVAPLLRFVVHGEVLVSEHEEITEAEADETTNFGDGLVGFADMPAPMQETVERSLEVARPENRDDIRQAIFIDSRPAKRRVA